MNCSVFPRRESLRLGLRGIRLPNRAAFRDHHARFARLTHDLLIPRSAVVVAARMYRLTYTLHLQASCYSGLLVPIEK